MYVLEARHGSEDGERFSWPGAPHQTRLEARGELFLLTLLSDESVLPSVHARGRLPGPTDTPKPGRVGHQSGDRLLGCRQELTQVVTRGHLCMT